MSTQQTGWCFQCGSDIDRLKDHAIGCAWGAYGPDHPEIAPMLDVTCPDCHSDDVSSFGDTGQRTHANLTDWHECCECRSTWMGADHPDHAMPNAL